MIRGYIVDSVFITQCVFIRINKKMNNFLKRLKVSQGSFQNNIADYDVQMRQDLPSKSWYYFH